MTDRVLSPRGLTWPCFLITGAARWVSSKSTCNAGDIGERDAVRSLGGEDPLEEGTATTPVLLPGESRGRRSQEGYSPWGCKESDTTKATWAPHCLLFKKIILSMIALTEKKEIHAYCRKSECFKVEIITYEKVYILCLHLTSHHENFPRKRFSKVIFEYYAMVPYKCTVKSIYFEEFSS